MEKLQEKVDENMLDKQIVNEKIVVSVGKPICPPQIIYTLMNIPAQEFAQQLSIYHHKLYSSISATELIHQRWKNKSQKLCPNVEKYCSHFNQLFYWFMNEILDPEKENKTAEDRAKIIIHLVAILVECFRLNNFMAVVSIVSVLSNFPISRLFKSWEVAGLPYANVVYLFNRIFDNNNSIYRTLYSSVGCSLLVFSSSLFFSLVFLILHTPTFLFRVNICTQLVNINLDTICRYHHQQCHTSD